MSAINLSGITFIKHGLELGYPFLEAIDCLQHFCDEVVVNVGFGTPDCDQDDGTLQAIEHRFAGNKKIVLMRSYWDPAITKGGQILAQQTDLALAQSQGKFCQYLQADEHIHEQDWSLIRELLPRLEEQKLDGAVFEYLHFYGNVDILKFTRKLYRREVRLIKNGLGIRSYRDAQGFRHANGEKLNCLLTPAKIFHYGWARKEMVMRKKVDSFGKIYHGQEHVDDQFAYQRIWGLRPFTGQHPALMQQWIEQHRNDVDLLKLPLNWQLSDLRSMASDCFENLTGIRVGEYRNFHVGGRL